MSLSTADQSRLESFWQHCVTNQYFNIGYPESADFDYAQLHRFLQFSINNCGDWNEYSNYLLNSFDFEKDVMTYFAELFNIALEDSWGYVTNGGTEGNMFGCYLGRELFPDGTLYYSKDTHYSVAKIVKLLRIKCRAVESLPNGEVDYDDLIAKITADQERHPIIFANIGTTMRGAVDNIATIQQRLQQAGIARHDYYLHADAALSGMILPFVDHPQPFSFADGIDSICVSGHKMIGSPIPCGIVVAKRKNVARVSVEVDYIRAHDKTISGSRNGHTPLMMWAALRSHSLADWRHRIKHSLDTAQYAVDRFQASGIDAWRNENSITVVFPCPSEKIATKYCLATSGTTAHLITTPHHHDNSMIDALIDEVVADAQAQAWRSRRTTGERTHHSICALTIDGDTNMPPLKAPEACENLNDIRAGIDFFDRQILQSLQKRLRYVKAAAQFKANEHEIPAPERVMAMLEERREWAQEAGVEVAFVEKLYEQIIDWNIQQQILHWRANYLPVHRAGTAS